MYCDTEECTVDIIHIDVHMDVYKENRGSTRHGGAKLANLNRRQDYDQL